MELIEIAITVLASLFLFGATVTLLIALSVFMFLNSKK